MKTYFKRTCIAVLVLAILLVSFPALLLPSAAAAGDGAILDKTADISTMDSWMQLFPENNTTQAGRVWTDKSVFTDASAFADLIDAEQNPASITMTDPDNNFLVALSTLASNKSIVGYSYTPTDTMLVLDASASMGNSNYVDELTVAANDAIKRLLSLNNHNRIGVVLYSGNTSNGNSGGSTATVLLPLDRYTTTAASGNFLQNNSQSSISVIRGAVRNSDGTVMSGSKNISGGTYTQNGIYMAMEELLEADTVIPDGEVQAGTTRTPIFVLMSDGLPTTATTNFGGQNNTANTVGLGTSNLGDGSATNDAVLKNVIDFVNQLTSAYVVKKVDDHYGASKPLFYTLGLGNNNAALNSPALNPSAYTSTDTLWANYVSATDGTNVIVDIESPSSSRPGSWNDDVDQASIRKLSEISSADQKNYVTQAFAANNAAGLTAAFDKIVNQIIIQSLYYPTLVNDSTHDHDGFVEFIDEIGHYMEVKDIKGILIGNTLFTGERLAVNFVPDGGLLIDANGNWTDMGNNVVWSVMERIGIDNAQDARDLINNAYNYGQLRYDTATGEWSNYIGWYADDDGNFMGFWHEGHTDADVPTDPATGVKATYINRSYGMLGEITDEHTATDLMYISTQVHTRISDGNVSLIWRVPASLIPVVSYHITLNGENLTDATTAAIEYAPADPIRIVFEVGLKDELHPVNLNEMVTDKADHIRDENGDGVSDDGKYYFYSNWWNDEGLSHENPSKVEDTIVFFEPSLQNERYYYVEETRVYVQDGDGYAEYVGAKPTAGDGTVYYREYVVFNQPAGQATADIVRRYEVMSDATVNSLTDSCRNADGTWDVPAGTVHRVLEPYNLVKADTSLTETLDYVRYPVIEQIPNVQSFHVGSLLGNNGRLAMDIPQGLKLTKRVDDTLYGTDLTFIFTVAGEADGDYLAYRELSDGTLTAETVTFANGSTAVELKADQSLYILGLPEKEFTVSEATGTDYVVSSVTVNGAASAASLPASATVTKHQLTEVVYTNTRLVTSGTIVVSKEVVMDDALTPNADQLFTFEWYDKADPNTRQTFTLKAGSTHVIDGLAAGTYVVNEIDLPNGYTPRINNREVTVTSGSSDVIPLHFINDYVPQTVKPIGLTVQGTKLLDGRDWQQGDSFTFKLQALQGATWHDLGSRDVAYNAAADYDYTFDFSTDLDLVDLGIEKAGTHYFRILEEVPANRLGGITYDETYRYFSVVVTDETMDGYLEIKEVRANAPLTVDSQNNLTWTVTADFTNEYDATEGDDIVITVDKTMLDLVGADTGRDGFTFGLYTVGGTEPILTTAPTDANGFTSLTLNFPASVLRENETERVYQFELREIIPENKINGMTYVTTPYPITIKVVDNLDGTVTAFASQGNALVDGLTVGFQNVYEPDEVTVTLQAKKELDGRELEPDEFTFALSGDGINGEETESNDSEGLVTFSELIFYSVGTYSYEIREINTGVAGVTYDLTTVHNVTVTVTDDVDNDGRLNAEIKVNGTTVDASTMAAALTITNTYAATEEATVPLQATKKLEGRQQALRDGEFKFDLYEADASYNKLGILKDDVTNDENGLIDFGTFTFAAETDAYFVILEDEVDENGITVDKKEYRVYIKVRDDLKGNWDAEVYVEDQLLNGAIADAIVFTNLYAPTVNAKLSLSGTKTLLGRDLNDGEFKFDLLTSDENGTAGTVLQDDVVLSLQPDGTGLITFADISLSEAKTYYYLVVEDELDENGITADKTLYRVTVVVTDDGFGTLVAEVSVNGTVINGSTADTIVFENLYAPKEATVNLTGNKELVGRELVEKEFSFGLYDKDGQLIETVTNAADGSITFTSFELDTVGTYTYVVKEIEGKDTDVTYDWTEYTVTVTVTDDGLGQLKVEYLYTDGNGDKQDSIAFVNLYNEPTPPSPDTSDVDMNNVLALLFVSGGILFTLSLFSKKKNAKAD